jgi:DNA-directed RNA polymerase specialized sigma24 family protein
MVTKDSLDQSLLDDLGLEESLLPHRKSHATTVKMTEMLLEELSFVPPNQEQEEVSVARPQRKVCHRLRKLVRSLTGPERKAIRFLYFRNLPRKKVAEKMKLNQRQLVLVLDSAFAKLRAGLAPMLTQQ